MLMCASLPAAPDKTHVMYPGTVVRAWPESEMQRGLAFVSEEVSRRHGRAGQFVRIRLGEAENPYALASEPGSPELELLIKPETELTTAMSKLVPGDAFLVGAAQGKGFPVSEHEGQDLILCAAGTGIAPLRAVVRSLLPSRARFGQVLLFYGQRTKAHFAYSGEHDAWRAAGIELHLVASEGGKRLQHAVRDRHPDTERACAYLCGMKGMVTDLAHILGELGLPRDRVFLNY